MRYAVVAAVLSFLITFISMAIFKKMSVAVVIGSSMLSGILLLYWFSNREKRVPQQSELNKIYFVYAALLALFWFGAPILTGHYTAPGLFTVLIYVLAYPAFLSFIFRKKTIEDLIKKNA